LKTSEKPVFKTSQKITQMVPDKNLISMSHNSSTASSITHNNASVEDTGMLNEGENGIYVVSIRYYFSETKPLHRVKY